MHTNLCPGSYKRDKRKIKGLVKRIMSGKMQKEDNWKERKTGQKNRTEKEEQPSWRKIKRRIKLCPSDKCVSVQLFQ